MPCVPQDLAAAQKAGLVRVPTHIVSVSCPPPTCPRSREASARHAHLRNISHLPAHKNLRALSDLVIVQTICDDRGEGEPDVLLANEHTAIERFPLPAAFAALLIKLRMCLELPITSSNCPPTSVRAETWAAMQSRPTRELRCPSSWRAISVLGTSSRCCGSSVSFPSARTHRAPFASCRGMISGAISSTLHGVLQVCHPFHRDGGHAMR